MGSLTVDGRFNGPPSSGNGGYTAGLLGELAGSPKHVVTVRLTAPPPLGRTLSVQAEDGAWRLTADGETVARARRAPDAALLAPPAVGVEEARAVEPSYAGLRSHPFPSCFTCGPGRDEGDGLRIFPGPVGDERVAATWVPDTSVGDPTGAVGVGVTWAALDCPGGWSSDLEHRPMVLGEITARIDRAPRVGSTYVVVGEHRRTDGRKTWTASALYDEQGDLLAEASHLWIAVDAAAFT